jgi:hypothetical protein
MPVDAVPLKGVEGALDEVAHVIVSVGERRIGEIRIEALNISGGEIVPQLVRAGHEEVRSAERLDSAFDT